MAPALAVKAAAKAAPLLWSTLLMPAPGAVASPAASAVTLVLPRGEAAATTTWPAAQQWADLRDTVPSEGSKLGLYSAHVEAGTEAFGRVRRQAYR